MKAKWDTYLQVDNSSEYISLLNISNINKLARPYEISNENGYIEYIQNLALTLGFEFNGYYGETLKFISILAITSAICVILSKNPIISVLFLIALFLTISLYLMALGLNFIGLSYLLVYVGAVSILFLFILMLINIRISEIVATTSNSIPLAIIISMVFMYTVYPALPFNKHIYISNMLTNRVKSLGLPLINSNNTIYPYNSLYVCDVNIPHMTNNSTISDIPLNTINPCVWDTILADTGHINSIGNVLYTVYPLWIILTSLILLLAMVGCILITVK